MTIPDRTPKSIYRVAVKYADGTEETISIGTDKPEAMLASEGFSHLVSDKKGKEVISMLLLHPEKARVIHASAAQTTDPAETTGTVPTVPVEPPAIAEFLCGCLVKPDRRDGVLGDLAEGYSKNLTSGSKRRADRLYWAAVFNTAGPLIWLALKRIAWAALGSTILRWWSS